MKVTIKQYGWNAGTSASMYTPWYRYLCIAENGIVTWVNTNQVIEDGIYELSDEDWSYDNPRWEKLEEQEYEEIEIA